MQQARRSCYTSAVCLIPPPRCWPSDGAIQQIRKVHDKSYVRWMPHANFVYGFLPDAYFDEAQEKLAQTVLDVAPFWVSFDSFRYFAHSRRSFTAWLEPTVIGGDQSVLVDLQSKLESAYPHCNEQSTKSDAGFIPHVSVGQFKNEAQMKKCIKEWESNWEPIRFLVKEMYIISRTRDDPFEVRKVIPFGLPYDESTTPTDITDEELQDISTDQSFFQEIPKPATTDDFKVHVGGLPRNVSDAQLEALFSTQLALDVKSAKVSKTAQGQSRGFGFVELTSVEAVLEAVEKANGVEAFGRILRVKIAN
eukprot:CAMPEP_0174258870 /NCGR_PEP_ID=MMETSP0439-20130205/7788_1 /TAXON_ID=0 /ORGANISM="Stereomyxa ramosa, Strain Chinc5" /LENGTH=306 /DNA_ID=CAMNT_0015342541 /DNA_START=39 /DNA_END=959 /DNA_ORIENTATION=+